MHINWQKTLLITLDVALATYLGFAFTKFNKPDEKGMLCTKVNINIEDEMTNGFLNAKEIKKRLEIKKLYPLEKPLNNVNARKIEETLKNQSLREDRRMLQNARRTGGYLPHPAYANCENQEHQQRGLLYR